jgi:hypothetical protein
MTYALLFATSEVGQPTRARRAKETVVVVVIRSGITVVLYTRAGAKKRPPLTASRCQRGPSLCYRVLVRRARRLRPA